MRPLILLAGLLLTAASCDDGTVRIRFVPVTAEMLLGKCPALYGHSSGCTVHENDGSVTIYGIPPKNVEDETAMIPLGHEFYCHGILNQSHERKDPSNDCVAPKKAD